MQGQVSVGQGLRVADVPAVVLRFDRTGVVAAALDTAEAGASVSSCGTLTLEPREWKAGVSHCSLSELVTPSGVSAESLLKLPSSRVSKRGPVRRHLPSGLAAMEALLPMAEGQRLGLVGPPGTGKSTALRMLVAAQAPDTAVVFVAHRARARLEADFADLSQRSAPVVILSAEPSSAAPERYFLLLAALRLAVKLGRSHRNVLLAVDDVVNFADAAAELGVPPMSAAQVVASTLEAAGNETSNGEPERALSVAMALDLSPTDELAMVPRDLWRSVEPSLDICVNFCSDLASKGVYPAIDLDWLNSTFGATHQAPLLRVLRDETRRMLHRSRGLKEKLATGKTLGFQAELEDVDTLGSDTVARALLTNSTASSLREVVVLTCASVVFYFPHQRPSRSEVANFQLQVVDLIRSYHPSLWERLDQDLSDAEARRVLQELGEVLFERRHDFHLTRPDI